MIHFDKYVFTLWDMRWREGQFFTLVLMPEKVKLTFSVALCIDVFVHIDGGPI